MGMNSSMDELDYSNVNFNLLGTSSTNINSHAACLRGHPLWLTEGHFIYHLHRDGQGDLHFVKDRFGEVLCSPRKLRSLCMKELVCRPNNLNRLKFNSLPCDLYPGLMSEAIFQRQLKSVAYFTSTWPFALLHVKSLISKEELVTEDFLTVPVNTVENMSLLDGITTGILDLKSHSQVKVINFAGFMHDRRLCLELLHLPILWMKPVDRQVGYLHTILRRSLRLTKGKVQRYLNRIACIYSSIDPLVRHGHVMAPLTIVMDCRLSVDDIPIGLALQHHSPFTYVCGRAWVEVLPDVTLPWTNLGQLFQSRYLTHLEIEEPEVCSNQARWEDLLEGLQTLTELQALSLPNTVHVTHLTTAATQLAHVLEHLHKLRKLSLASCTLRGSLEHLLEHLQGRIIYLNLRDCRLTLTDIGSLLLWPGVIHLRELNLSRNNLSELPLMVCSLVDLVPRITCFSISYCCLSIESVRDVIHHCMDCTSLKVLCVQSFVPPPSYEMRGMLEDCAGIPTLQKCVLLPEAYAFPGTHISQRAQNHEEALTQCVEYLTQLGRPDLQIE